MAILVGSTVKACCGVNDDSDWRGIDGGRWLEWNQWRVGFRFRLRERMCFVFAFLMEGENVLCVCVFGRERMCFERK